MQRNSLNHAIRSAHKTAVNATGLDIAAAENLADRLYKQLESRWCNATAADLSKLDKQIIKYYRVKSAALS